MQKPLILTLLLVPAIALVAAYDQLPMNSPAETIEASKSLDFHAYSIGINTVIYGINGEVNYTLQANRQVQYNDDSTEFDKPFVRLFQAGESHWNLVADSGVISAENMAVDQDQRSIEFSGNVEVYSIDEFGNRTIMTTDKLLLNPHTETLTTDAAVVVETSSIKQTAIGMIAKLESDEIIFHREIRGIYEQLPAK